LTEASARLWLLEAADAARAFPRRALGAHKGDFGHLLLVGGSVGKTGAVALAATAALRSGAGLVTVAMPAPALPIVAAARPEVMTEPLAATPSGSMAVGAVERALDLAGGRDAVVLGPGLGQDPETRAFVRGFIQRCSLPLVIDADGLNALAGHAQEPAAVRLMQREHPTVATPHPGEMARLAGGTSSGIQKRRLEAARALAVETGAVVVLKGQRSIIAERSGRAAVNPSGNPGLATAGTGDVLSGIAGAFLARGHDAWLSATAAVYLHGHSGDRAAERVGVESLVAGDVIEALPEAIRGVVG
jgi:NAD(P)H-hydrate epimerase